MKYPIKDLIIDKISGEWGAEGTNVKVLRTTNFTNTGKIDFDSVVTRNISDTKINKKHLRSGDILIEKSGGGPKQPVGRVVFFDLETNEKYLCNNFTAILRPDKEAVVPKFFFYQLLQLHVRGKTLKYQNKTTGIHNLRLDEYLEEKIVVPPLSTQHYIANILIKAENLIAQRKESIALLDEFLKSTFLEMFGDTRDYQKDELVKTIGEICSYRGGGTPSKSKPEYYTGDIPWVSPKDMKSLYISSSIDKITEQAIRESATSLILKNSVLMVIRSGILKSKLPIAINTVDVAINQDMKAFSSKEVNSQYLLYFFLVEERNILKKVKGTTADNLNFEDIKNLSIKIPCAQTQTQFAQIVEKTEALKAQYQKSLRELENLYGSLGQRAFKGKLKPDDRGADMLMAAESDTPYQMQTKFSIPPQKKGFAKLVLARKIISECKDRPEFTNIKFQKLQHLVEHLMEADLNLNYYNQAAGPYDNRFMHTLHEKMKQQKWFSSKGYKYYPMEKVKEIDGHFSRYFGADNLQFSKLIKLLGKASEDQCEIVSTLYAVWNDRIIRKEPTTQEAIIADFFKWSERKQKYTTKQLNNAIQWMREKELEPRGFGVLIKHRKKK